MNAAERIKFFIESTDKDPKLPVSVGVLPEPSLNIAVEIVDYRICQRYCINYLLANKESCFFPEETALSSAICAVRIRAQKEVPELELFPYVDVGKVGKMRGVVEALLQSEEDLEVIDCKIMSRLACAIWRTGKGKLSLPLIRHLVPLHASDVISVTDELLIKL